MDVVLTLTKWQEDANKGWSGVEELISSSNCRATSLLESVPDPTTQYQSRERAMVCCSWLQYAADVPRVLMWLLLLLLLFVRWVSFSACTMSTQYGDMVLGLIIDGNLHNRSRWF